MQISKKNNRASIERRYYFVITILARFDNEELRVGDFINLHFFLFEFGGLKNYVANKFNKLSSGI